MAEVGWGGGVSLVATADDKDSEVYDFGGLTRYSGNFNKQKKK